MAISVDDLPLISVPALNKVKISIGKKKTGETRTVIVRFLRFPEREMVFKSAREMQEETNVKVYADYPKEISQRRKQQWPRIKNALLVLFFFCSFLFIACFEIILSVCACKNLLGPQLLYVQFVVPDICMLLNILSLTSHIQKRICKF